MKLQLSLAHGSWQVDLSQPLHISIELLFNEQQPNHFGVNDAISQPVSAGSFVGDVTQGGSCNVDTISLTPHCNGTHTECIGHITRDSFSIHQQLNDVFIPTRLITLCPELASSTQDNYLPTLDSGDKVITREALATKLGDIPDDEINAVVIRTLPNTLTKTFMRYDEQNYPPFLTLDAVHYLNERNVKHLLVDFPSIDRMYDDGKMSSHSAYWHVNKQRDLTEHSDAMKTITEMVFADLSIEDGFYLLNLQVAPFALDAAPSRPVLFPLESKN